MARMLVRIQNKFKYYIAAFFKGLVTLGCYLTNGSCLQSFTGIKFGSFTM